MPKKEYYRHALPHFQQPGQAYFVTWCLKDSIPPKALERYSNELSVLQTQLNALTGGGEFQLAVNHSKDLHTKQLKKSYQQVRQKYLKAYNDILDVEKEPKINLASRESTALIHDALNFWHGKRIENIACCVMPNHVHWVLQLYRKDENNRTVYLEDLMQSVKRYTSTFINKLEKRSGILWQNENFDKTIRNETHLQYEINYTLNNPVKAGLTNSWKSWRGNWCNEDYLH